MLYFAILCNTFYFYIYIGGRKCQIKFGQMKNCTSIFVQKICGTGKTKVHVLTIELITIKKVRPAINIYKNTAELKTIMREPLIMQQ